MVQRSASRPPTHEVDYYLEEYNSFRVAGGFHIKWYALIKHVMLFIILVASMQLEVGEYEYLCEKRSNKTSSVVTSFSCSRSTCHWLILITGSIPGNMAYNHSHICSFMQAIAFFSCLSVLTTLYCRHRRMHLQWTFRRYLVCILAVVPSIITELFIIFFWFYTLVSAITLRFNATATHPQAATMRTFILCMLLSITAFFEVILHIFSMAYLISFPHQEISDSFIDNYRVDSLLEQAKNHSMMSRRGAMSVVSNTRQNEDSVFNRTTDNNFTGSKFNFLSSNDATPSRARSLRASRFLPNQAGGSFPRNFCPPVNNADLLRRRQPTDMTGSRSNTSTYDQINYTDAANDDDERVTLTPRPRISSCGVRPSVETPPHVDEDYHF